ncbi:MAG: phosphoenolpyruvate--protein phosphotransferase [Nitrospinota bacterium]
MSPIKKRRHKKKETILEGISVSRGLAMAKTYLMDHGGFCILKNFITDDQVEVEIERLNNALYKSKQELSNIVEKGVKELGPQSIRVLESQLTMLDDPLLSEKTTNYIRSRKINADWALKIYLDEIEEKFKKIDNEYIKDRIKDIAEITNLVHHNMLKEEGRNTSLYSSEPIIIVAHDLFASDIIKLKQKNVLGFVTDTGGKTSHLGVIATAIGIPAIVGLKNISERAIMGEPVIVDGNSGQVILAPNEKTLEIYKKKEKELKKYEKELLKGIKEEAVTKDGFKINLLGNIEYSDDLDLATKYGAQGIGLYRTEYLFINHEGYPSEKEQFEDYKKVAEWCQNKSYAIIRTLDLGPKKNLAEGKDSNEDKNSALGLRGIRFCLNRKDIFKTQLRAIFRSSHYGHLKIMYPMISDVKEIREANKVLKESMSELDKEGISYDKKIEVGAMIEVPSAAISIDIICKEVDFVSIGTNDLIQYTMAADRDNETLTYLYQPFHPAIIRILRRIITTAEELKTPVSICGLMGSDPLSVFMIIGFGKIESFSMDPHLLPTIHTLIRNIRSKDASSLAEEIINTDDSDKIMQLINNRLTKLGLKDRISLDA